MNMDNSKFSSELPARLPGTVSKGEMTHYDYVYRIRFFGIEDSMHGVEKVEKSNVSASAMILELRVT